MSNESLPSHRVSGWIPALPDARHRPFAPKLSAAGPIPPAVDLRPKLPPVWDQGEIGSCTSQGVGICHIAAQQLAGVKNPITPARLALYYMSRAVRGWTRMDTGAYITDVMKVVAKLGVANEVLYPYNIAKFKRKPPVSVYTDALKHQGLRYEKIDNRNPHTIMLALAEGLPVVFGSSLYENYPQLSADNVMPMPDLSTSNIGGHCMAVVGYDWPKRRFLIRNSWGPSWGDNGHHWMSFDYICNVNLTDDVWILRTVET
jgi:C1A family cysteine protease